MYHRITKMGHPFSITRTTHTYVLEMGGNTYETHLNAYKCHTSVILRDIKQYYPAWVCSPPQSEAISSDTHLSKLPRICLLFKLHKLPYADTNGRWASHFLLLVVTMVHTRMFNSNLATQILRKINCLILVNHRAPSVNSQPLLVDWPSSMEDR